MYGLRNPVSNLYYTHTLGHAWRNVVLSGIYAAKIPSLLFHHPRVLGKRWTGECE